MCRGKNPFKSHESYNVQGLKLISSSAIEDIYSRRRFSLLQKEEVTRKKRAPTVSGDSNIVEG